MVDATVVETNCNNLVRNVAMYSGKSPFYVNSLSCMYCYKYPHPLLTGNTVKLKLYWPMWVISQQSELDGWDNKCLV